MYSGYPVIYKALNKSPIYSLGLWDITMRHATTQNEIMEYKRQAWNPIPHLNEGGKRKKKKNYSVSSPPKIWAWLQNGNNWAWAGDIWKALYFLLGTVRIYIGIRNSFIELPFLTLH